MKTTVSVPAIGERSAPVTFKGAIVRYVGRGVGKVVAAWYTPDGKSIELDLDLDDDLEITSIVRSYSVPS